MVASMVRRARDYEPGEQVPGTVYQVFRVIGVGGMGTVYDVEDTIVGKRFVLKTLHAQLGAREDLALRMRKEARTLGRLSHPNIVEVITAGVTADDLRLPYYVMERLDGQSLRLVLEKKWQLELPHAYHIAIDLLDALDHAHDKNVIHRDVKPDNIFLHRTPAGLTVTKLLDFGIISQLDSGSRETAGRFLGTLRYAAPEQLRGETPTPHVDVYAAGLVLYEMVAGRGPFDDQGDPHDIAAAHLHRTPPPVSRFVPVPRELDRLIMATLAKTPQARPPDAFSLAASLRNLKRMLAGTTASVSTENRATAAALGGLNATVAPSGVRPTSGGDGAASVPSPASPSAAVGTGLPATTLRGMVPPPAEASAALPATTSSPRTTPPVITARVPVVRPVPQGVDRLAETRSLVPEVRRVPHWGTEAFAATLPPIPFPGKLPSMPPPVVLPTPVTPSFQWPVERAAPRSEEAQVRSVLATLPPFRPSRLPVVVAAIVMASLAASVVIVFAVGHPTVAAGALQSKRHLSRLR